MRTAPHMRMHTVRRSWACATAASRQCRRRRSTPTSAPPWTCRRHHRWRALSYGSRPTSHHRTRDCGSASGHSLHPARGDRTPPPVPSANCSVVLSLNADTPLTAARDPAMHTLARAPAQTTLHASRRPLSPVRGWGRGASNHDVMLRRPPRQPDSNDQVIEDIIAHSGIPGGIAAALRHETVQPLHGVDDRHAFGQPPNPPHTPTPSGRRQNRAAAPA